MGGDLETGQDIAASGKRVTWLSFWTVSGPVAANPDGSACYTSTCYYNDSFAAGKFVATTIDSYAGQGLSLKPDWVILDPEGFPRERLLEDALSEVTSEKESVGPPAPQGGKKPDMSDADVLRLVVLGAKVAGSRHPGEACRAIAARQP